MSRLPRRVPGDPCPVIASRAASALLILAAISLLACGAGTSRAEALFASAYLWFDCPGAPYNNNNVIGDFDEDGVPDVASQQSLLLGIGDGTFAPALAISAPDSWGQGLAGSDLNGDGHLDLVCSIRDGSSPYDSNRVVVRLGDGTGHFGGGTAYVTGQQNVWGLDTGDLNADGVPDLVVIMAYGPNSTGVILLYEGVGDGSFTSPDTLRTSIAPLQLVLADLDADSDLDLVISTYSGINVFVGHGDGSFDAPVVYLDNQYGYFDLEVVDFDADGDLDVVTTTYGLVAVLLGAGDGSFPDLVSLNLSPDSPYGIAFADVNGDGTLDLVTAEQISGGYGQVFVRLGTGPGSFLPAPLVFEFVDAREALDFADLNRDGFPDLVGGSLYSGGGIAVLPGRGGGGFGWASRFPVGRLPWQVRMADLNADGLDDVLVACDEAGAVEVFVSRDSCRFDLVRRFDAGDAPRTLAVADVDHDGHADILVGGAAGIALLAGDGAGGFGLPVTFGVTGAPVEDVAIADFDEDSHPDVMARVSAGMALLRGDGAGGFTAAGSWPLDRLYDGPAGLVVEDFDGDDHKDIATPSRAAFNSDRFIHVFSGNGDGTFDAPLNLLTPGALGLAAGDMNADGRPDLVAAGPDLSVFLAVPGGGFAPPVTTTVIFDHGIALSDFDGDGDLDVAGVTENPGSSPALVGVLPGLGDGTFAPASKYGTATDARGLECGDLDGDGRPDLAVISWGIGYLTDEVVSFLRNTGGMPWTGCNHPPLDVVPAVAGGPTLEAPYPNPARSAIRLSFTLPQATAASLRVYDVAGRQVATLASGVLPAGRQVATWDRGSRAGGALRPGVYLCELRSGGIRAVRRVVVLE